MFVMLTHGRCPAHFATDRLSLPCGGMFAIGFEVQSSAAPRQFSGVGGQPVQRAMARRMFIVADIDVKFGQARTEVVFARDNSRSQGVDPSQGAQDPSTMLGGNY